MRRVLTDITLATHRIFTRLSPRMEPAAPTASMMERARAAAILDTFDVVHMPALLFDRSLSVVGNNGAAERLFDADLRIVRGRLVSTDRGATANLERMLQIVIRNNTSSEPIKPVTLPRSTRRPLLACPQRLRVLSSGVLAPCHAVVVLMDLEQDRRPHETTLRAVFGLTPAEARLTAGLASGQALSDTAAELGIGKETARAQLKSVFDKMGVRRQAELVALLARLPDETNIFA